VIIETKIGSNKDGSVALDDVLISPGECSEPLTCNFDNGLCLWTQSKDDKVNWEVVKEFGSLHDHNTDDGTGSFLILKNTPGTSVEGNNAIMLSENLILLDKACLSFWYNMYGDHIGALRVIRKNIGDHSFWNVWELNGQHGNQTSWKFASLTLWKTNLDSYVGFEAVIGKVDTNKTCQIGVDDIKFENGVQCDIKPPGAAITTIGPSTSTTPIPTPPPAEFECDFERLIFGRFCNWNPAGEEAQWDIGKGSLGIEGIGPPFDHTTGSGHYAYISRSSDDTSEANYTATLISPDVFKNGDNCFVFWYFTWGQLTQLKVR
ncbi:unnamed protein product, partial [Meganyctiphanes norvegica]